MVGQNHNSIITQEPLEEMSSLAFSVDSNKEMGANDIVTQRLKI